VMRSTKPSRRREPGVPSCDTATFSGSMTSSGSL
jgi:hypothetical protein